MSFLGLFSYPKEIKQLKSQIPKTDRKAFLASYKKLSKSNKASFEQALRNADINAASKILDKDLSQYQITLNKQTSKTNDKAITAYKNVKNTAIFPNTTVVNQINEKQVMPTILPSEAARRYAYAKTNGTNADASLIMPSTQSTALAIAATTPTNTTLPENQTKLFRIDSSGIFAIPDGMSSKDIQSVLVNGKTISENEYAITENGNIDIFGADENSVVSVLLTVNS